MPNTIKLFIQVPCFNEEKTIKPTLEAIPKKIEGIDSISIVVIDDGSTDNTIKVAKENGADFILKHKSNLGLARSFMSGIEFCIKKKADIIINTDGDNQYFAEDMKKLVHPILHDNADVVIGARPIDEIKHFSYFKKLLQKIGSWTVRQFSSTKVLDATCGFRAYTVEAAKILNVFNTYTYTIETIIQLGFLNKSIVSVPVRVNEKTRESRLMKSIFEYVLRSMIIILRIYLFYKPFKFFSYLSLFFFTPGFILILRFFYHYFQNPEISQYTQSLTIGLFSVLISFLIFSIALISDLISANRNLLEKILRKEKDDEK